MRRDGASGGPPYYQHSSQNTNANPNSQQQQQAPSNQGQQNPQRWNASQIRDLSAQFSHAVSIQSDHHSNTTQQNLSAKNKPYIYDPMCFLDIEMTDNDPQKGKVAEIAVYLTSGDLRLQILIANLIIKLEMSELNGNTEVVKRFTKSGLWQDLQNPEKVTPLVEAEELIIKQFEEYGISHGQIPSAGIQAYNDRICLERQMPSFNKFLNFTIVDISSVDEVASRWNKRVFNKRESKESRLRAEPNARRAITRLQYYKTQLFKSGGGGATVDRSGGSQYQQQQPPQSWWNVIADPYNAYQPWDSSSSSSVPANQGSQQADGGGNSGSTNIPTIYPGQQFWRGQD